MHVEKCRWRIRRLMKEAFTVTMFTWSVTDGTWQIVSAPIYRRVPCDISQPASWKAAISYPAHHWKCNATTVTIYPFANASRVTKSSPALTFPGKHWVWRKWDLTRLSRNRWELEGEGPEGEGTRSKTPLQQLLNTRWVQTWPEARNNTEMKTETQSFKHMITAILFPFIGQTYWCHVTVPLCGLL